MARARTTTLALLLLILLPGFAAADVFVISDFETQADLEQWEPTGAIVHCPEGWCVETLATISRVTDYATHGSYSCLIEMPPPPTSWPGMNLISFPITDWSAYDVLRMDFHNPKAFALLLHVEISDSVAGSDWPKRYYTELTLVPGINHIEIDLHNLPRNDGSGDVNTANIDRFLFYATGFASQTNMYCDYVRLETVEDDPWADAARDIYKFDFGTTESPRWPDFFRVTASDTYAASPGWGWSGGDSRYGADLGGPDGLCRDCVRYDVWWGTNLELDFRVDLPNDTYGVYVIARSGEWHGMPVRGWQIWAEGACQVNVPMDEAAFYSSSYYYRGSDDDYPLGTSYWERYVAPNFPAYSFTAAVVDGHLDLRFVDAWIYMLIIYPTSESAEMNTRIAGWEADRRAQFEATYYVNEPESCTFVPTAEETARGYAAWPVPTLDPCYPDTLPPSPRPALQLSAAACQSDMRAVTFAIRPVRNLTGVAVEVSNLQDTEGHVIPSSQVVCHYVRYMATPNSEFFSPVLYWKPHLLQRDLPIDVAEQVTKQFWLDIHVPDATPGGTYTGTVTLRTSAADLVVPLTLEVWPFQLDAADGMSYGWYYMSPDERYCFKDFPGLSGAGDAMLRLDFADMKQHGFNAVEFPAPECWPIDWATGWVDTVNMAELDRYAAAMADTGFGGLGRDQVGVLSVARQIMSHSSVSEFDANFDAAYKDVLARMVSWGGTDGVPLVMYLVDEPRETNIQPWNRNLADTLQYCDLAHQVPGVVSTVTIMADTNNGVDYTPIVDEIDVLQTHPYPPSSGLISRAQSQDKPIWFYNTWDDEMWTQYRWGDLRLVYGFYQYKMGDGCWEWHFDWLDGDMWDPFPYSPFNNHWHYTYPSPDGPVATLKYEWASQGISDYRYAATLARMAADARASGNPDLVALADQADALLQSLVDDIPDYPTGSGEHFAGLSLGPSYLSDLQAALDSYRWQIAELIAQIAGWVPGRECELVGMTLPDSLTWNASVDASITLGNRGTDTWKGDGSYLLLPGGGADRWDVGVIPLEKDVAPGKACIFDFTLMAPPWTTLRYPGAASMTEPAHIDALPCNWLFAKSGDVLSGGQVTHEIAISRFPDVQPGSSSEWARSHIEECAGRIPFIVEGYGDGRYHGDWTVSRAAMAVFIARAAEYELALLEGDPFPDVAAGFWAAPEIKACVDHEVVKGYLDGLYRPASQVTRDEMAVYIQRARRFPLPTLEDGPFPDVSQDFWAAREIQACVDNDVVKGYLDGLYRPRWNVTRDQMAVFVYRAFIQPTAAVVVLGGPAITSVDLGSEVLLPGDAAYYGWPSTSRAVRSDPGWAYIAFDAARLDASLAAEEDFEITFAMRDSDGVVVDEYVVPLSFGLIESASEGARTSGGPPHLTVGWNIPGGMPRGEYEIAVTCTKGTPNPETPIDLVLE